MSSRRSELALTMPSAGWLVVLFLIPTALVVTLAFRPADLYGAMTHGWTLDTIRGLFTPHFWTLAYRTIWISAISTAFCVLLGLPVAYTIARARPGARNILLMMTVLPFWSSFVVRIFAWKTLLHPEGIAKRLLVWLHFVDNDAILLYSSATVLLVMVYSHLPFAILPLYAAASHFDFSLCEAAMDLGMSQRQTFWRIFVPGIRSGVATAVLMCFIPAFGSYVIPDVVGGPSSEMLGNRIVQKTFLERNLPEACALSVLLALAVVVPAGLWALSRKRRQLPARNVE